jgi:epoxyqueuosine reductase QueG
MNSNDIKKQAAKNGARLCGIAGIERFNEAPAGFNPTDLFPQTQSVIAFAKQMSKSALTLSSLIPYTVEEGNALHESHRIAVELALYIESQGYKAVMVPSEPYEYWDAENLTGKGLLSLKHVAYQCGLGAWGRNHLIYNPNIGSLMKIGAVLTDAVLETDAVLSKEICKPGCHLCASSCPSGAITQNGVQQWKCRPTSEGENAKGIDIYTCNTCRKVCPNVSGFACNEGGGVYLP